MCSLGGGKLGLEVLRLPMSMGHHPKFPAVRSLRVWGLGFRVWCLGFRVAGVTLVQSGADRVLQGLQA